MRHWAGRAGKTLRWISAALVLSILAGPGWAEEVTEHPMWLKAVEWHQRLERAEKPLDDSTRAELDEAFRGLKRTHDDYFAQAERFTPELKRHADDVAAYEADLARYTAGVGNIKTEAELRRYQQWQERLAAWKTRIDGRAADVNRRIDAHNRKVEEWVADEVQPYSTRVETAIGDPSEFVLTVLRQYQSARCTSGYLAVNGAIICYTLERPWKNNQQNISSIPAGRYRAFLRYDKGDHWRIQLDGVPGRTGVQIHVGNAVDDTQGCILVGTGLGSDLCTLTGSANAYSELKKRFYGSATPKLTPDREIFVVVKDGSVR